MSGSPYIGGYVGERGFATNLIPNAWDPGFTNFRKQFNQLQPGQDAPVRDGPIRSNPVPFRLVANAPAIVIASQNDFRKGLMIQNKDPTDILYVGFGSLADINSLQVMPLGSTFLFDFVCPTDTISVFATVNLSGFLLEMAPIAQ